MNLYYLTKKYGEGKGEQMMWKALAIVSEAVENNMEPAAKDRMVREIYGEMSGYHYNEEYAKCDVEKMYYVDKGGSKKFAPYWTVEQVDEVYSAVKDQIPSEYNMWDFYVALQMMKSDNCRLLREWFPDAGEEEHEQKLVELTINWLNDVDNPYGTSKVWKYVNGGLTK